MASHRRTRETHRAGNRWLLGVVVILVASGCRSTGGASKMSGMGWMAGSQKSVADTSDEVDPTVTFPAPSSASTPQTLADLERPSSVPTHQAVNYNAAPQGAGGVVPANYPSTDYATIAANGAGMRPEPNPVAHAATAPAHSPGSEYVQNGNYQSNSASTYAAAATTWGSTAPAGSVNPPSAAQASGSIYSTGGAPVATPASQNGYSATASDSVYGNAMNAASPAAYSSDTTWSASTPPSVYSNGTGAAAIPGATDPGMTAGTIAQATYQSPAPRETAPQAQGVTGEMRTASAAGQAWLPGSTTTYIAR